jgi:hypothetical protein
LGWRECNVVGKTQTFASSTHLLTRSSLDDASELSLEISSEMGVFHGRLSSPDSDESIGAAVNPTVLALSFHSIFAQEGPSESLSAALSIWIDRTLDSRKGYD